MNKKAVVNQADALRHTTFYSSFFCIMDFWAST